MTRRRIVVPKRAIPENLRPMDAQVSELRTRLQAMPADPPVWTPPAVPAGKVTKVELEGGMGKHDLGREVDHLSDTGNGFYAKLSEETGPIEPTTPPELPEHVRWILAAIPTWAARFTEKSVDYGDAVNELGAQGQFSDMHRKMGKLKRAMWHNEKLTGEQPIEILEDLIGHCFLSMYFLSHPEAEEG